MTNRRDLRARPGGWARLGLLAVAVALIFLTPARAQTDEAGVARSEYSQARDKLGALFEALGELRASVVETDFDPDARARSLGPEVGDLFRFVRDEIVYEPYRGAMRLARGTLMSGAGNACDQSLLLAEMLRAQSHEVRFARAVLPGSASARLLAAVAPPKSAALARPLADLVDPRLAVRLSDLGLTAEESDAAMREARAEIDGFLDALSRGFDFDNALLAARLADAGVAVDAGGDDGAAFLDAARDHCWVQVRQGDGWLDLDPASGDLAMGERFAASGRTFDTLPVDLLYRVKVVVRVAQTKEGKRLDHVVLDTTVPLDRPISRLSLSMLPEPDGGDTSLERISDPAFLRNFTVAWPVLQLDGAPRRGKPFDMNGEPVAEDPASRAKAGGGDPMTGITKTLGGLFGGGAPATPAPAAATGRLDGVTLTLTLIAPGGRETVVEREIVRPLPDGIDEATAKRRARQQLLGRFDLLASASRIPATYLLAREIDHLLANRATMFSLLADSFGEPLPGRDEIYRSKTTPYPFEILTFLALQSALLDYNRAQNFSDLAAFASAPRLVAFRVGPASAGGGPAAIDARFDIMIDEIGVLPRGGTPATPEVGKRIATLRAQQGVVDTLTEYLLLGGGEAVNAHSVIARAVRDEVPIVVLRGENDPDLARLAVDPAIAAHIAAALRAGYAVIAPTRPVTLEGRPAFAWWRVDPKTGATLGMGGLGEGQGMVAYIIKQTPAILTMTTICVLFSAVLEGEVTLTNTAVCVALSVVGGLIARPIQFGFTRALSWVLARIAPAFAASLGAGEAAAVAAATGEAAAVGAGAGEAAVAGGVLAGGRAMFGRGGSRPGPQPVIETPGASGRSSGRFSEAGRPPSGSGARPIEEVVSSRAGTNIDRPAYTPTGTEIVRPARRATGTGGEVPASGGRRPAPGFDALVEAEPYLGHPKSMPVAREHWRGLSPAERQVARDAYQRLRAADPLGDPRRQLNETINNARDASSVPEVMARTALNDPNGVNLRALADAAGVTPRQMRQILDAQVPNMTQGRELSVAADGTLRLRPTTPENAGRSLHERQLMELNRNPDRREAAREARWRAERDLQDGMSSGESLTGNAFQNEIPPGEFLKRTGQTPAEARQNLARYLERRYRMSKAEAESAANDYFGPETGKPAAAPRDVDPLGESGEMNSPWGTPPKGGETPSWQERPGTPRKVTETPAERPKTEIIPRAEMERTAGEGQPKTEIIPRPEMERIAGEGQPKTEIIPRPEMERIAGEGQPKTEIIPRAEMERIAGADKGAGKGETRPVVEELTPEDLGLARRTTPEEVVARLEAKERSGQKLSTTEQVELWQARMKARAEREAVVRRRRQAELLQRQRQAGDYEVGARELPPQRTPESGRTPRRQIVPGDARYVENIMAGSPYRPTQQRVSASVVNDYVTRMMRGEPLPRSSDNLPIMIGPEGQIISGHHRMIAARIVSRLTGRPLTAAQGPDPVIPGNQMQTNVPTTRQPRGWRLGVDP